LPVLWRREETVFPAPIGHSTKTPIIRARCIAMCGITMYPQDGSGVTPQTDMLVFSTAVEPTSRKLVKAVN
jgi:hypothetical protein